MQGIAFRQHPIEDHRNDAVAQLAVDRLTVVPLEFLHVFKLTLA